MIYSFSEPPYQMQPQFTKKNTLPIEFLSHCFLITSYAFPVLVFLIPVLFHKFELRIEFGTMKN